MGFEPLELIKSDRRGPFYLAAAWLWRRLEKYRGKYAAAGAQKADGRAVLTDIYGEGKAKLLYKEFQIRKIEQLLMVLCAGAGLAAVLSIAAYVQAQEDGVTALDRPQSVEGSKVYELNVKAGSEKLEGITVEVPPQKLTLSEQEQVLLAAEEELNELLEKAGWLPDGVQEDLSLPDTLQGGLVEVRWESSCYDLIDGTGHVRNELVEEEGEMVQLQAILFCESRERILTYPVRVIPKDSGLAARLSRETARQLLEEETEEESKLFILPGEFEGKPLSWQLARPAYGGWILLGTLLGCLALNFAFERDLSREGEKRREELLFLYPSFLTRLTLLAGTGMPVRMIFLRMAKEGAGENALPVYEEVLRTCREMESGTIELQAYENFGKRCRLPQYKKCASLLAQNVRKGTGGLLEALNQEAVNAFEERKALARKKGEEAQTRLLVPMLMMLAVVMILIMVPACFSFGGM